LAKTKASKEKDVVDGLSLVPLLSGKGKIPERPIFCHFPRTAQIGAEVGGSSIRSGNYKLYRLYGANTDATDSYELYDLANDIGETKDLSNELPEVSKKLKNQLNAWLINTKALVPHKNPAWDFSLPKKRGQESQSDAE
jgi:arylsulfatase A-like enzyme